MGINISARSGIRGLVTGVIAVSLVFIMSCKPPAATTTTPPTTTTTPPVITTPPVASTTPPPVTTTTTLPTTTTTIPPTTTTTPPPVTTTTPPPVTFGATWGELAKRGRFVFTICTTCHGEGGLGDWAPEIIGPRLGIFGNAQVLYDSIRFGMPVTDPGSLSDLQYLRVLAYLLVTSNFVQPEVIFDADNLAAIPISNQSASQ